jgi:hypothetical protein
MNGSNGKGQLAWIPTVKTPPNVGGQFSLGRLPEDKTQTLPAEPGYSHVCFF